MKKLTISIADDVYDGLQRTVGRRRIGRFLENLARPHVVSKELKTAYQAMAADTEREREAEAWVEALAGDVAHEAR
jgi:hypothetical protein